MIETSLLVVGGAAYFGARTFGLLPSQKRRKRELTSTQHAKPLKPVEQTEHSPEEEKKLVDHYFKVSSGVLGVSAITLATLPAAHILAIPPLLYTLVPVFADAYDGLRQRQLRPSLIESLAVGGAIGLGMLNNLNPYFFAAGAVGVWMYFLSARLVLKTKDNSIKELTNLFGEQARTAWLLRDGVEIEVPFEQIQVGDVVVVSAGGMIPVDGNIIRGMGSVDQRMLTGESQPVEKTLGEPVFAATTLLTGSLQISVEKAGEDAVAAQIGEIWSRTADYRTMIETRGEQFSQRAVAPTLGVSAVALATLGPISAIAILLSNFSDAIQLASPLSTLNFLHLASKEGILIKDGRALESLKNVDTVVFDKTGTLTLDQPHVGAIYVCENEQGIDEDRLLTLTAAAEARQTHPVAKAIIQAAQDKALELPPLSDAAYQVGYGIKAKIDGHWVRVGSDRFMAAEQVTVPENIQKQQSLSHAQGHSLIMVAVDEALAGAIALYPTVRPEAQDIVTGLKARGVTPYILSGDHQQPTQALAQALGIEHYFAETLPEDKAKRIEQLQEAGHVVCFIGDGINDTIALKQANVSISMSGATSAAMDTAQVIMMDGRLKHLEKLFKLSDQYDRNLGHGFKTVLGGSLVCIGGVFFLHFGIFSALSLQAVTLASSVGNAYIPKLQDKYGHLLPAPKKDVSKLPVS